MKNIKDNLRSKNKNVNDSEMNNSLFESEMTDEMPYLFDEYAAAVKKKYEELNTTQGIFKYLYLENSELLTLSEEFIKFANKTEPDDVDKQISMEFGHYARIAHEKVNAILMLIPFIKWILEEKKQVAVQLFVKNLEITKKEFQLYKEYISEEKDIVEDKIINLKMIIFDLRITKILEYLKLIKYE